MRARADRGNTSKATAAWPSGRLRLARASCEHRETPSCGGITLRLLEIYGPNLRSRHHLSIEFQREKCPQPGTEREAEPKFRARPDAARCQCHCARGPGADCPRYRHHVQRPRSHALGSDAVALPRTSAEWPPPGSWAMRAIEAHAPCGALPLAGSAPNTGAERSAPRPKARGFGWQTLARNGKPGWAWNFLEFGDRTYARGTDGWLVICCKSAIDDGVQVNARYWRTGSFVDVDDGTHCQQQAPQAVLLPLRHRKSRQNVACKAHRVHIDVCMCHRHAAEVTPGDSRDIHAGRKFHVWPLKLRDLPRAAVTLRNGLPPLGRPFCVFFRKSGCGTREPIARRFTALGRRGRRRWFMGPRDVCPFAHARDLGQVPRPGGGGDAMPPFSPPRPRRARAQRVRTALRQREGCCWQLEGVALSAPLPLDSTPPPRATCDDARVARPHTQPFEFPPGDDRPAVSFIHVHDRGER
ncbi:hypothetical protein C8Q70DRAFT_935675 [Cubamyces menziesii]|nr:hypothetical protein C8Q70DRAFT_935675 [Cubamyces menziesii]